MKEQRSEIGFGMDKISYKLCGVALYVGIFTKWSIYDIVYMRNFCAEALS